ncbi:hypothetical protein YC2023_082930 [Brassica napus]
MTKQNIIVHIGVTLNYLDWGCLHLPGLPDSRTGNITHHGADCENQEIHPPGIFIWDTTNKLRFLRHNAFIWDSDKKFIPQPLRHIASDGKLTSKSGDLLLPPSSMSFA